MELNDLNQTLQIRMADGEEKDKQTMTNSHTQEL